MPAPTQCNFGPGLVNISLIMSPLLTVFLSVLIYSAIEKNFLLSHNGDELFKLCCEYWSLLFRRSKILHSCNIVFFVSGTFKHPTSSNLRSLSHLLYVFLQIVWEYQFYCSKYLLSVSILVWFLIYFQSVLIYSQDSRFFLTDGWHRVIFWKRFLELLYIFANIASSSDDIPFCFDTLDKTCQKLFKYNFSIPFLPIIWS